MSVCPWCKSNVPDANVRCSVCGKKAEDHPSIASGGYATMGGFDDFDQEGVPGLDLDGDVAPLAQAQDGPDLFGGDDFEGSEARLDLEVEPAAIRIGTPAPQERMLELPGQPTRPKGPAPPDGAVQLDPHEIAVMADFGPPPSALWEFPLYAWRVSGRRSQLRTALGRARAAAAAVESVRDDHLARLGEAVGPQLEKSPELAVLLQSLQQVEATTQERQEALEGRNEEFAARVGEVDQRIGAHEQQGAELRQRRDASQRDFDANELAFRRAQAAHKRAEIELRNAQGVARGTDASVAADAQTRLPALLQIVGERKAELRAPQAALDQARATLAEHQHALQTVERSIRALRAERTKIEQAYGREIGLRSQGVDRAQAERRAAFVAVGARLIEMGSPLVDAATREDFFRVQEDLNVQQLGVEKTVRAIESADAEAVKKGWRLLIGAGVASLLLLIALIALLGRSETG